MKQVEKENQHPWWHFVFETHYYTIYYRDGILRGMTPDLNVYKYRCLWPDCKFHKTVTEIKHD